MVGAGSLAFQVVAKFKSGIFLGHQLVQKLFGL